MVAPIDSKVTFHVEGEPITLRLNFRSIALAESEGLDVLAGKVLSPMKVAVLLRCLAVQDHPEMSDEEAFAIAIRGGDAVGKALADLFAQFGGKASAGGKAPREKPKAKP